MKLCERRLKERPVHTIRPTRLPRRWVYALLLVGVLLYLGAAVSLTKEAAEHETLSGDLQVTAAVQDTTFPGVGEFVVALNWIGKPVPLAVLAGMIAVGLLSLRRYSEALLVMPTMFSHALNYMLKDLAASPRPTPDLVRVTDHASGFGFPSGHTMATVVFCGVVIYLAWRLIYHRQLRVAVQVLAGIAVVGIGFSRIYSGAHWPSDVLGGYLWGTFYAVILVLAYHRMRPHELARSEA
jgi:undecaprenyl-diphosphatase